MKKTMSQVAAKSLLVLCVAAFCGKALADDTSSPSYTKEEKRKSDRELIRMQLNNEMQYASDVYFGEHTDVSYIDGVRPSEEVPEEPEKTETTVRSSKSDSSDDNSEETVEAAATTTSRRPRNNRNNTEDPPTVDPPPVVDPPGGGGGCPT